MRFLGKLLDRVEQIFVGLALLAITSLLFINVILRYFFSSALSWAEEASRYGVVWIVFIGASICVCKGSHIVVDALTAKLSARWQRPFALGVTFFSILFCCVFTILSLRLTLRIAEFGQMSTTLGIPMLYVYGAMPVGGALMTLRYAQQAWRLLRGKETLT